jgi:tetratricopeptide (TPR) repeat protein
MAIPKKFSIGATLCLVDSQNHALAARAMWQTLAAMKFADALFFSDLGTDTGGARHVAIAPLDGRAAYSRFIVKGMLDYIQTEHVLLIQWDGYVVNPAAWTDEFLKYDYIGAPWGFHADAYRVGNGGFSLRSRRLLEALQDPEIVDLDPEDEAICRRYRPMLEHRYGIRFAPEEVAARFSFETTYPQGVPFGFHALYNMWMFIAPEEFDAFLAMLSPQILASPQLLQLGRNYKDLGKTREAMAILNRRLQVSPQDQEAIALLRTMEKPRPITQAVTSRNAPCPCDSGKRYKECCGQLPDMNKPEQSVGGLLTAAMQHHQSGKLFEAGALYGQILRRDPGNVFALHYSGVLLMQQGKVSVAESLLRQSLALQAAIPDFHSNLGLCLRAQDRLDEAVACYRQALGINPEYVEALNNMGLDLQQMGQIQDALKCFEQAVSIRPDFAQAHWNLGLALLLQGEFERGWAEYEWRLNCPEFRMGSGIPNGVLPWKSEPIAGKSILLLREQGAGDNFQFVRYAKILADQGAKVVVEATPESADLMASAPGIANVVRPGEPPMGVDYYCPMLSLPHRSRNLTQSIPSELPYLTPPPQVMEKWSRQFQSIQGLKIGLVWAGSPTHANDHNRSCRLVDLAPLLGISGINWFSLQKGQAADQLQQLHSKSIMDLGLMLNDFSDTAAVISHLDLIIAVDTSVVHLSGALNKSCWVMLPYAPDFRWLLGREASAWYPSLSLFRQPKPGDWASVVSTISSALADMIKC